MILLRVDDFPGTKPNEFHKHNLESFKQFDAIVKKYVPSYLLGVIPKHATSEQLLWLSQNKYIKVALHGINHDERYQNEFGAWLTDNDVYSALLSAKLLLKCSVGYDIDTYIPPHNCFDQRTIKQLKYTGFKNIAGGPGSPQNFKSDLINYLYSEHPKGYGRSDELMERGSVEWLTSRKDDVWLTLHFPWEINVGLEFLEKYLSQLGGFFGDVI